MSAGTATYRLYNEAGELLYVGVGNTPEIRFRDHARRKPWWPEVVRKDVRWHPDRRAALRDEATAIKSEHPRYNVAAPPLDGSLRGGTFRTGLSAAARGNSPKRTEMRSCRIPDDVWLPALAKAEAMGLTATDAVTAGLRWYSGEPLPAAYEFTLSAWPEAAVWGQKRGKALAALGVGLTGATGVVVGEWLTVAAWLAASQHPGDAEQQQRIIAGHVIRVIIFEQDDISWAEKFRTAKHLLEVVQAVVGEHVPFG